jgi:hypothetical protein
LGLIGEAPAAAESCAMPDQGAKPLALELGWGHWILRGPFPDCADNRRGAGQPEAPYELR